MANVLLGVTGSVAAIKTPDLYALLKHEGHAVKIVATRPALYFFDDAALDPIDPTRPERNPAIVVLDEDEWPGHGEGRRWQRAEPVLHIELRRWADLFVIAPLDANTLAKLAHGFCDNCLTCVWRAWEPERPRLLAPAMNTRMWEHPATARQLRQIAADTGLSPPEGLDEETVVWWVNENHPRLKVAMPVSKRLACDDEGMGAMAESGDIVDHVRALCPV